MTPEEIAGIQRREEALHSCNLSSYQHSPIWRLCQYALTAKRAGAEEALQGMVEWLSNELRNGDPMSDRSLWTCAALRETEKRIAALKEDKTDG